MSMFENDQYRWRETYFVLFDSGNRPKLGAVEKALHQLDARYQLANSDADEDGLFKSLTLISPDTSPPLTSAIPRATRFASRCEI